MLTKEELLNHNHDHMTVGGLKRFLEENNIPDSAPIVVQRVEDTYYEGVDISGMRGEGGIYPPGSKAKGWETYNKKTFFPDEGENKYTPIWSPVFYKDDNDILFLDLHY